ncbi:transposase [Solihabitans fulvus]|uniref:Transposase n=1 Tax=Solihabitans fulvus TaxID=1892852 RepID=A0A5B2WPM9_9PSEU|nr:transposase [Solihabitans fulvus]KAA2252672.1 transposase [Solihabitans fulvus]
MAHADLAAGKRSARDTGAWLCFEDETGAALSSPVRTTWSAVGQTPVVPLSGRGHDKISVAGMCCYRPGHVPRLIYTASRHHFSATDFPGLLRTVHRRLAAPIVVIWDNLPGHISGSTRAFIRDNKDWLTVIRLPGYAPHLNPTEGVWCHLKGGVLANLGARTLTELTRVTRRGLRHIQRHPHLLTGFLAQTGLTLHTDPSTP